MKPNIIVLAICLSSFSSFTLFGQEEPEVETKAVEAASALVQSAQEQYWSSMIMMGFNNNLVSDDGHYAAQNELELQTYYDLEMDYQYIESPLIRRQLQLEKDQGIIIAAAKEPGEGYKIGFRPDDLVLRVDDVFVDTQYDLVIALAERRGKSAVALVRRDGKEKELEFSLSEVETKERSRWIIGVSVDEMSELLQLHLGCPGVVITSVTENGPAEKMGLKTDDIISKIDGKEVNDLEQLRTAVQESQGKTLTLDLVRGNRMTINVTPEKREKAQDIETAQPAMAQLFLQRQVALDPNSSQWQVQVKPQLRIAGQPDKQSQVNLQSILDSIAELQTQVEALRQAMDK